MFAVVPGVARLSSAYTPRDPSAGVLYRIVRDHLETFRAQAAGLRGGEGLPRFVEEEFRAFLRCGWLAGGFARFQCAGCGRDHLVAFSCKGRGFCPSCGGRRMAERAAHLVDRVLPDVPVRQWVLSLPVVLQLRRPWANGTTALVFEPTAFLERLALLVPRPRINLVLYHGVLGARAAWRREVVPGATPCAPAAEEAATSGSGGRGWRWADLMRRVFAFDVLACPRCGGRLRLIAVLEASAVTVRILQHLHLPAEVPAARPSRAPPIDWVA